MCVCVLRPQGAGIKAYIYTESVLHPSVLSGVSELPPPLPASLPVLLGCTLLQFMLFGQAPSVFLTFLPSPPEKPPLDYDFD